MKRIIFHEKIGQYLPRKELITTDILAEEYILRGINDINTSCTDLITMAFSENYTVIIACDKENRGFSFAVVLKLNKLYDVNDPFYNISRYAVTENLGDVYENK